MTRAAGIKAIQRRVYTAYPGWTSWPRELRKLLLLTPTYGSGEYGLRSACQGQGWEYDEISEMSANYPDHGEALSDYEKDGEFRRGTTTSGHTMKDPVSLDQMLIVFAVEELPAAVGRMGTKILSRADEAMLRESGLLSLRDVTEARSVAHHLGEREQWDDDEYGSGESGLDWSDNEPDPYG